MRCYNFHDTQVAVLTRVPSPDPDADLVHEVEDFDQARFPLARLLAIWNALPGAEPVTRFRDRSVAVKRLWAALEALPLNMSGSTSKPDNIIALLRRPTGASLDELMTATGWQRHSVRGVLSGVVRKKRGLNVISAREGDRRVYRIAP